MENNKIEFIDYCLEFYGDGGIYDFNMTREELTEGLERRLKNRPDVPFDGDTIDREFVRDEVLAMRKGDLGQPNGEVLRLFEEEDK
tara:strand:- start:667 stop:924 length:258 start_codon:yes stop_codon:yes gene_type:complete